MERQYLDALIQSYLTHLGKVEPGGEAWCEMQDEIKRLREVQSGLGLVPYPRPPH
jgi:hypothetical protein